MRRVVRCFYEIFTRPRNCACIICPNNQVQLLFTYQERRTSGAEMSISTQTTKQMVSVTRFEQFRYSLRLCRLPFQPLKYNRQYYNIKPKINLRPFPKTRAMSIFTLTFWKETENTLTSDRLQKYRSYKWHVRNTEIPMRGIIKLSMFVTIKSRIGRNTNILLNNTLKYLLKLYYIS